jgi:hypothetical protein
MAGTSSKSASFLLELRMEYGNDETNHVMHLLAMTYIHIQSLKFSESCCFE